VYVFDDGTPVGFRLATNHSERITAIITQNGNAHEEARVTNPRTAGPRHWCYRDP
jgi:hypothetical protein